MNVFSTPQGRNTPTYVFMCVSLYIYIYNPQTDCFVVSQFFSMTRHTTCFKLGLKPGWLYISQISYPRAIIILSISEGIFSAYILTYTLLTTRVLNSWAELCIYTYVAASNSPLECSINWREHIYCHPQTIRFHCITTLQCG